MHGVGEAVAALDQGAEPVRELLGEHGDDLIGEVDAGAPRQGLVVQHRARAHVVAHVGDVHPDLDPPVAQLADGDGVVVVLRVVAVDRVDELTTEVLPALHVLLGRIVREALHLREHVREEDRADPEGAQQLQLVRPLLAIAGGPLHHRAVRPWSPPDPCPSVAVGIRQALELRVIDLDLAVLVRQAPAAPLRLLRLSGLVALGLEQVLEAPEGAASLAATAPIVAAPLSHGSSLAPRSRTSPARAQRCRISTASEALKPATTPPPITQTRSPSRTGSIPWRGVGRGASSAQRSSTGS